MSFSHYDVTVPQFIKVLGNMNGWLDKAQAHADSRKFDVQNLMTARLAPDQFPFVKQVQIATDAAKGIAARLIGQDPPKFEDTETTLADVRNRIGKTITFLKTLKPEMYAKAGEKPLAIPFMPGKALAANEYMFQMSIPNFYFHATTAYAILRHNGVDLGKMDYIGHLNFLDL